LAEYTGVGFLAVCYPGSVGCEWKTNGRFAGEANSALRVKKEPWLVAAQEIGMESSRVSISSSVDLLR
jgi:hypothetical protein